MFSLIDYVGVTINVINDVIIINILILSIYFLPNFKKIILLCYPINIEYESDLIYKNKKKT